jgi:hypothetical protein
MRIANGRLASQLLPAITQLWGCERIPPLWRNGGGAIRENLSIREPGERVHAENNLVFRACAIFV